MGQTSLTIPESKHISNRPKRFAFTAFVAGLAALLSTVSMGTGISNVVDLTKIEETIHHLESNQAKISIELSELTRDLLEMKTDHHNVFMALKQSVDIAKAQTELNACAIGLNKLDNIIESILSQTLTNHILPAHQIMEFLRENSILKDSFYTIFPRLAYKLGRIELVNVDPERHIFTILVLLPHISAAPDGHFYHPLFAPRFFPQGNGTMVEHIPFIPPLYTLDDPSDTQTDLLSMDDSKCQYLNVAVVCPLTAQSYTPATTCSNAILRNETGLPLAEACSIVTHPSPHERLTTIAESATSLLLFTNQGVKGVGPTGFMDIVAASAPPSCVMINKISLSQLKIGERTVIINLRTDAYSLAPQDREVMRHLHALRGPISDPMAAQKASHFNPISAHFGTSLLGVISISASLIMVLAILSWLGRKLRSFWKFNNGDFHRQQSFLRSTPRFEEDRPCPTRSSDLA